MCFRPLVFLSSQRMRPCHNQLQRERQAKLLICLHQDLKQSRGLQLYLKCFPVPNATHSSSFHLYLFNKRDCKYNNVSVSSSYYYLLLHHEEILVCRPFRGCIHSHGSGLFLWMMRPRCHRKWRRVFREKLVFFSVSLKRKQNRSLLFSSLFKKLF